MNGYCLYQYNIHEQYVTPNMGNVCGRETFVLEGRETPDPWCPEHGGTPDASASVSAPETNPTE